MYQLKGHVIRPPAEADSVILQATWGCPHNACTFCGTYRALAHRVLPVDEFECHVRDATEVYPAHHPRIFLADGDVMSLATPDLLERMAVVKSHFPQANRFSLYARAEGILSKSDNELNDLRTAGLRTAYLGLESGDDSVLTRIAKGSTAESMTRAVQRAQACGIRLSVMALIGLGGREGTTEHADATARVLSAMNPRFLSLLTLRILPGTELHEALNAGTFTPLSEAEALAETERILTGLTCTGTIFRSDHASNALPLAGSLPRDRERLLAELNQAASGTRSLRPAWLRGL
ncbi:MAG: radical SAM protein [Planctomycetota bacterium]|jgi:radical SAM superfamily enzyme YgiQ (UPF0313 family)